MNFFDLHNDTVYELHQNNANLKNNGLAVNLDELKAFKKFSAAFALWIKDGIKAPYDLYRVLFDTYKTRVLPFTACNFKPYLAVEGGALIENEPERVYTLKNDGVIYLTLTWNGQNSLASGCKAVGGITYFGKETVKIMNDCRIACDLSHINDRGFYEAFEISAYPIVTHTAFRSVNSHIRNITDDMAIKIKEKNGIIGICFYDEFLGEGNTFDQIAKHIYKGLLSGLEDNLAIGSDFDGAVMDSSLSALSKTVDLYEYLIKYVADKKTLEKIFCFNAENYIKALTKDGI